MTDTNVMIFATRFLRDLVKFGNRPNLNTEQRRMVTLALREERAMLSVQHRLPSNLDKWIEKAIAKADAPIRPIEAGLKD